MDSPERPEPWFAVARVGKIVGLTGFVLFPAAFVAAGIVSLDVVAWLWVTSVVLMLVGIILTGVGTLFGVTARGTGRESLGFPVVPAPTDKATSPPNDAP